MSPPPLLCRISTWFSWWSPFGSTMKTCVAIEQNVRHTIKKITWKFPSHRGHTRCHSSARVRQDTEKASENWATLRTGTLSQKSHKILKKWTILEFFRVSFQYYSSLRLYERQNKTTRVDSVFPRFHSCNNTVPLRQGVKWSGEAIKLISNFHTHFLCLGGLSLNCDSECVRAEKGTFM